MAKYLLLKHYRRNAGPANLVDIPMEQWSPAEIDAHIGYMNDFAAKLEAEYRIPVYAGRGSIYGVDLFGAAGLYGLATRREFTDAPTGYDGFARVPVDVTYNLGLRVDTAVGGVTLAFSNLLGLIPARRGARK